MLMMTPRSSFSRPPAWDAEEDDRLVCRAVYHETHDVKTFVFSAPEPRQFHFAPGQFLTFDIPVGGGSMNRCYTIASSPTRPHTVAITVKRLPGGPVSNWLHDNLRVGDQLRAVGPLGQFSTESYPCFKRLLLAGGVGITPFMSIARHDFDLGEDLDTILVHFARTPDDIMFAQELDLMAKRRAHLQVVQVVNGVAGNSGWPGYRGRISRALLELIVPDFVDREVFCCGPAPFMAAAREILKGSGFAPGSYHEESFNFADLSPAEQDAAPLADGAGAEVRQHTITFARTGRTIGCDENTTILGAARAAGLRLPSSCTKGLCGTCKTRKLSGDVTMNHGGGIRQREIDQGQILICCSTPNSDIVLER